MKFRFILFSLLICLALPKSLPMLTIDQAKQRIRQLEGIPDLRLTYLGLDTELGEDFELSLPRYVDLDIGEDSVLPWPCYVFKTDYPDNSILRYYVFEPFTGQIIQWCNPLAVVSPKEGSPSDMLDREQLVQSAINFFKRWHPDFNPSLYIISGGWPYKDFSTGQDVYSQTVYIHFWLPDTVNEQGWKLINGLSFFSVRLDSTTGQVCRFWGWHFLPVNISLSPTISSDQALQIALNIFHNPPFYPYVDYAEGVVYGLSVHLADGCLPPSHQRLKWNIGIYTLSSNPQYQEDFGSPNEARWWGVSVDAHTGEVLGEILPGGLEKGATIARDEKKLKEFLKAKNIKASWKVIDGDKEGSDVKLYPLVNGRRFYIRIEQAWIFGVFGKREKEGVVLSYHNKVMKLGQKDVLEKDSGLYVPLNAVLKIAGYEAKYGQKEKAIYIHKKGKKKEKAEGATGGGLSLSALSYVLGSS
jgi:hypothetical protein